MEVKNVLNKPTSPSTLLEAIGSAPRQGHHGRHPTTRRIDNCEGRRGQAARARCLVEDNDMNQELPSSCSPARGRELAVVAVNTPEALTSWPGDRDSTAC